MKRVHVESGIYIRVADSGRVSGNCFEVVKARTVPRFKDAIKLFKQLHSKWQTVYMYQTMWGFRVEFKGYTSNLEDARILKEQVEEIIGGWENEEE